MNLGRIENVPTLEKTIVVFDYSYVLVCFAKSEDAFKTPNGRRSLSFYADLRFSVVYSHTQCRLFACNGNLDQDQRTLFAMA